MMRVTGANRIDGFAERAKKDIEAALLNSMKLAVKAAHESLLKHTPVFTGLAVRNFVWTSGSPYSGPYTMPSELTPTGRTRGTSLGSEPRRAENEAVSTGTLSNIDFTKPYQTIFVTNNAPDIEGLEEGLLPSPADSRSRFGIFAVMESEMELNMNAIVIGEFL